MGACDHCEAKVLKGEGMEILKEIFTDNIVLAILAVLGITILAIAVAPKTETLGIMSYGITAIGSLATGKALSK